MQDFFRKEKEMEEFLKAGVISSTHGVRGEIFRLK